MDITETYTEEAIELLFELENSLLELEKKPNDKELISRVFRAMHTIKGSGAMAGFDNIASFTHDIETVFDLVRGNIIPVTKELIDLTLSSCDQIKKMVKNEPIDLKYSEEIIKGFQEMVPVTEKASEKNDIDASVNIPEYETNEEITYRIRFHPAGDIFTNGTNPVLLLNEIRALGDCSLFAQTGNIPALEEMEPEQCYLYWDIILTTDKGENTIRDVFIFIEDNSEIDIKVIDDCGILMDDEKRKKIGEILVEREDISPDEIAAALQDQKRIGEILIDSGKINKDKLEAALEEQEYLDKLKNKQKKEAAGSSIRVASGKLDNLVDLVGELVTVQARLTQHSSSNRNPELASIAEEVERLTSELRDNTMSIRMLPIGTTFSKFKRLVRDLSNQLGKEVILSTEGGETELDKTVIESLNDPMVHIIRNSIDHGIEPPNDRDAAGKPGQGVVNLSATHSGGNVLIRISDDGAGLDTHSIRAKAEEKGLITPDAELEDKDIYYLIFEPGFSTAAEVTDVSGRGVGMDVVKKGIENLRGSIEVESQKGRGTTITLKLPLTLAIIDGLLVDIGKDLYVIPLSVVEECVEMSREEANRSRERNMMNFRGNVVPYLNLRDMFQVEGDPPALEQVVIVEANNKTVGFGVDKLIGQNQTVIKTLSKVYKDVKGLSGATILGDGNVALILDMTELVKSIKNRDEGDK
ncbi:MAG: chemotaxis protein CheA [Desulfobacteraceae bacterium]|jgi:two-component system chemotaxis sensor kinase CheA